MSIRIKKDLFDELLKEAGRRELGINGLLMDAIASELPHLPPPKNGISTVRRTIRIRQWRRAVEEKAAAQGTTISDIVCRCLQRHLEKQKNSVSKVA